MASAALYKEWSVRPELADHVVCTWAARFADSGQPHTDRVLPDGCIDILWTGTRLMVAGPDTSSVPIQRRPNGFFAGVRFRPGVAPCFLDVPASALLDLRVDARDVLGSRAAPLIDRLTVAPSLRATAQLLESALLDWLPASRAPDVLVQGAVAALRATPHARPITALARQLGASERQLHRRFVAQVGYGAKTLHRVVRLRRVIALAAKTPALGLAALAADAGYADQAHLARDCQRLGGVSASRLVGSLVTAG